MVHDYNSYFTVDGVKYKSGTKVRFSSDFYERHKGFKCGWAALSPSPSWFYYTSEDNGKTVWLFNNGLIDDLVWERDVVEIIDPIYYVEKTDKDRIREKKERGEAWEYVWPGTIVYIICMIFITVFNERIWGWIAATIVYMNYRYERLSK